MHILQSATPKYIRYVESIAVLCATRQIYLGVHHVFVNQRNKRWHVIRYHVTKFFLIFFFLEV